MINRAKEKNRQITNVMFSLLISIIFLIFICRSRSAIDYMKKGLELCARTVIPSLFPLMSISQLAVRCGSGRLIGKIFAYPARLILGVGEDSVSALIFGAVCGFPIGVSTLCAAYDSGRISKREFTRALTFCNNPGAAFVISAVGVSLFGSLRLGITLFICIIISALLVGIAQRLIFGSVNEKNEKTNGDTDIQHSVGLISTFTSAIQSSALSMLTVCAYVVFFSSLAGCLGTILSDLGISSTVIVAVFGIFELSGGVSAAADLPSFWAIPLSAAFLGWSGLSVHFQIMTIAEGRNISFMPYFISKAVQSLLCSVLFTAATKMLPFTEDVFGELGGKMPSVAFTNTAIASVILLCAVLLPIGINSTKKLLTKNRRAQ